MRGLLFAIAMLATTVQGFTLGKVEPVRGPFCLTEGDAILIAKADITGGFDAAAKKFNELDGCDVGQAMVKPLRVVFSGKTERGTTVTVLEIEANVEGQKYIVYLITE